MEIPADVLNRKVVRVRENIGGNAAPPQFGVNFNHRRDFVKMSAKNSPNSSIVPQKLVTLQTASKNSCRVSRPDS